MDKRGLVLTPAFHLSEAEEVVRRFFPVDAFDQISTETIREEPMRFLRDYFHKYEKVIFFTYDLDLQKHPILLALVLLWLARRKAYFIDQQGCIIRVTYPRLLWQYLPELIRDLIWTPLILRQVNQDLRVLAGSRNSSRLGSNTKLYFERARHNVGGVEK